MKSIKNIYNFFDVSLLSNDTQSSFRGTFGMTLYAGLMQVLCRSYAELILVANTLSEHKLSTFFSLS